MQGGEEGTNFRRRPGARDVRFTPPKKQTLTGDAWLSVKCKKRTKRIAANQQLFDHLVSGGQQRRGSGETKRPGGPKIDYELKFRRLFNG